MRTPQPHEYLGVGLVLVVFCVAPVLFSRCNRTTAAQRTAAMQSRHSSPCRRQRFVRKVLILIQDAPHVLRNRAEKPSRARFQIDVIGASRCGHKAWRSCQIRQSFNVQIGAAVQVVNGVGLVLFAAHDQHRFAAELRLQHDVGEELSGEQDALMIGAVDEKYDAVCLTEARERHSSSRCKTHTQNYSATLRTSR